MMRKSVAKSLLIAAIFMLIIVGVVILLTSRDPQVPANKMGDTVIGERTGNAAEGTMELATEETAEDTKAQDTAAEPAANAPAENTANDTADAAADTADAAADDTQQPADADAAQPAEEQEPEAEPEPASVDLPNEKEIQLYVGGGGVMQQVTEYDSVWTVDADIASFEAFNTTEPVIYYDNYYLVHQLYWDGVATDTQYKIGYELSFDVDGTHKVYTILQPSDVSDNPDFYMGDYAYDDFGNLITDGITGYLGVWLYNDMYHDSTYIHLTQDEMTDETVMTSIKLRPTPQSDAISNLHLTAFSYSSDEEFNSQGHYIGTHGYDIAINNQ